MGCIETCVRRGRAERRGVHYAFLEDGGVLVGEADADHGWGGRGSERRSWSLGVAVEAGILRPREESPTMESATDVWLRPGERRRTGCWIMVSLEKCRRKLAEEVTFVFLMKVTGTD